MPSSATRPGSSWRAGCRWCSPRSGSPSWARRCATRSIRGCARRSEVALLEIDGLSVDFAGTQRPIHALREISFSIERGRIVGLVGESGSGKSTLSLAILRLLAPSARIVAGTIRFEGTDLFALSEDAMRALRGERISMVFQDPMSTLNPVLTIGTQMVDVQFRHAG